MKHVRTSLRNQANSINWGIILTTSWLYKTKVNQKMKSQFVPELLICTLFYTCAEKYLLWFLLKINWTNSWKCWMSQDFAPEFQTFKANSHWGMLSHCEHKYEIPVIMIGYDYYNTLANVWHNLTIYIYKKWQKSNTWPHQGGYQLTFYNKYDISQTMNKPEIENESTIDKNEYYTHCGIKARKFPSFPC